jgi:hypothetical protein
MIRLARLAPMAAVLALVAAPPAGAAPKVACPIKTGVVSRGAERLLLYGQEHPAGGPMIGKTVRFFHFYETQRRRAVLRLGGNRYTFEPHSTFKLGCYGQSKGGPLLAAVRLLRGSVAVSPAHNKPGGVVTEEGLYGPIGLSSTHYSVRRKLTSPRALDMAAKIDWFADYSDQPSGTTTVNGHGDVNITPYVGSQPGVCRHVSVARLTTRGRFGHGSASYRGGRLAPGGEGVAH